MGFLASAAPWLLTAVLFGAMLAAWEIAYAVGGRMAHRADGPFTDQSATVEAAVLALVGLLLAFTFQMSAQRYEDRRLLVLAEANAIGTAALRTDVLPDPDRVEVRALVRRYVDARLAFYDAGNDPDHIARALEDARRLQDQAWSRVAALAREDPRAGAYMLALQSLNAVIDLDAERVDAFRDHVPASVLLLLLVGAVLGMASVGYCHGLVRRRHAMATLVLSSLIAAFVMVILDLDRPRRGLSLVSQRSMIELRQALDAPPPPLPDPGRSATGSP